MSEAADKKIEELEQDLRISKEIIVLLLDKAGGSVTLSMEESRKKLKDAGDRLLDMQFDYEHDEWTVRLIELEQ